MQSPGPVVHIIVSLMKSLRHQLVKYVYADYIIKIINTLLFLQRFSYFSTKNNSVLVIFMHTLSNNVINFEQSGPVV